jgi:hypothetical protein
MFVLGLIGLILSVDMGEKFSLNAYGIYGV